MQKLKSMPGKYGANYYKLCAHLEISNRTLDRWMSLAPDCASSIPSDEFYKIAEFFECKPDELLNK